MQLVPVTDQLTAKAFLQVAVDIYKHIPEWIRPLDKDIEEVFDPKKNKAFRFGKIERFLLQDAAGNFIGRFAVFINKKYRNKGDDLPVGGIGFFECIDDKEAAHFIFDKAEAWLMENGMQAMDGPINFGERDKWWGLVTKGFQPPLYGMNYNPPYYQQLFEGYGFQPFFNQVCFSTNPKEVLSPKLLQRHQVFATDPDFKVITCDKNKLELFAKHFAIVYNKAWAGHGGAKEMAPEQVLILFKTMKPVMDEKILWFAYHKEEPIAMFINLPDLNQWFKYLHGKFGLLDKLKFLWVKKFKPNKKFTGIAFGVVPEWQGKGIDAFIIGEASIQLRKPESPYIDYEMQWIGDFNPRMINVAENMGDTFRSRNLVTYRYLFDRNKEFKRHPFLH